MQEMAATDMAAEQRLEVIRTMAIKVKARGCAAEITVGGALTELLE